MLINDKILQNQEKIIFALRELYLNSGYTPYRMSKFEEYDLYAKNKDFLVSDNVITFTNTDGKLMPLKPDVTLSIIKNNADEPIGKPDSRHQYRHQSLCHTTLGRPRLRLGKPDSTKFYGCGTGRTGNETLSAQTLRFLSVTDCTVCGLHHCSQPTGIQFVDNTPTLYVCDVSRIGVNTETGRYCRINPNCKTKTGRKKLTGIFTIINLENS